MLKHEKTSIVAVTSWLAFGVTLSLQLSDWSYFERCGSAIAIIGVLITISDFSGALDSVSSDTILENKILNILYKVDPNLSENPCMSNEFDKAYSEFQKIDKTLKSRLIYFEGGIIILGTAIWGFSAPILNYFMPL